MKKLEKVKKIIAVVLCLCMMITGMVSVKAETSGNTETIHSVESGEDNSNVDISVGYVFESPTEDGKDVFIQLDEQNMNFSEVVLTVRLGEEERRVAVDTLIENVAAFHLQKEDILVSISGLADGEKFVSELLSLEAESGQEVSDAERMEEYSESEIIGQSIVDNAQEDVNAIGDAFRQVSEDTLSVYGRVRKNPVVVIDPGHSKKSSGTYKTWDGITYHEEDLTMKIAAYTKAALERYGNITVYLTRDESGNPSLYERVKFAADKGAAALVSIHLNSAGDKNESTTTANGVEAMVAKIGSYNPENAKEGQNLADEILKELVRLGFKDRGFVFRMGDGAYPDNSQADYYAIVRHGQELGVPSIIVEHGFLNNEYDFRKYLSTEDGLKRLGEADAKGIAAYLGVVDSGEGWGTDVDGYRYYVQNGIKVTGWEEIDGKVYYFDSKGRAVPGTPVIDGKKYWLGADGEKQYGWLKFMGMRMYFDPNDNGAAAVGITEVNGEKYIFDANGVVIEGNGTPIYDGKKYYLVNSVITTGWLQLGSWKMYFDPENNGVGVTGLKTIEGKVYCFDGNGIMIPVPTGMFVLDGKKYYVPESGKFFTGWLQLTADWRLYFDPGDNGAAATGIKAVGSKVYYFDTNGVMQKGIMPIINGKKYYFGNDGAAYTGWLQLTKDWRLYFDPADQGAAAVGFKMIHTKLYYFDINGIMQTAGMPIINGKKYYVKDDGAFYTGWLQLTPTWTLYCDPADHGAVLTGFQTIENNRYYFDANGILMTGFFKVGGKQYCANKEGVLYIGGTPMIDGKKYAFKGDGEQVFGWYDLAAFKMYFNPEDNGAAVTGYIEIDHAVYQFNEDGVLIDSSVKYVTVKDPMNGKSYTLEGTYITDPQIGKDVTEDEFLASVLYTEAGDQGFAGQVAVAMTILNRSESLSFPDTLSFIIYAKNQFEVARNGTLTKYLTAFRDKDEKTLKWLRSAQSLEAVQEARKIMNAYKSTGTKRVISGITMPNGKEDFNYLFFMTHEAFARLGLDAEKCDTLIYNGHIFFEKWVSLI